MGFPKSSKYRVLVPTLTEERLRILESKAGNQHELAMLLLQELFAEELCSPNRYCCTKSEGRELLKQEYLTGIRCTCT